MKAEEKTKTAPQKKKKIIIIHPPDFRNTMFLVRGFGRIIQIHLQLDKLYGIILKIYYNN